LQDRLGAIGDQTAKVLNVFLSAPDTPRSGWDVAQATGLRVVSVYRIISNLDRAGWVVPERADGPSPPLRPRYAMTPEGAAAARRQLAERDAEAARRNQPAGQPRETRRGTRTPARAGPESAATRNADAGPPEISAETAEVLRVFLGDPHTPRDAWGVAEAAGLRRVRADRIIDSLSRAGWVVPELVHGTGGPLRRRYTMPSTGVAAARRQVAELAAEYRLISDNRAGGASWQLIAGRLGHESAQAAMARYGALARMLEIISPD
jgi:DNA-binding PadR family transcriptional regulator